MNATMTRSSLVLEEQSGRIGAVGLIDDLVREL